MPRTLAYGLLLALYTVALPGNHAFDWTGPANDIIGAFAGPTGWLTDMARTKSSGRWLQEHVNDPYVKQAQKEGYRARSSYKLLELNERDRLVRPGMRIVDLGSAPGGWSQVAARLVGDKGCVIATDILPMDSIRNVEFVQGDFREQAVLEEILSRVGGEIWSSTTWPLFAGYCSSRCENAFMRLIRPFE